MLFLRRAVFFEMDLDDGDVGGGDAGDTAGLAKGFWAKEGQFFFGLRAKMNDYFVIEGRRDAFFIQRVKHRG